MKRFGIRLLIFLLAAVSLSGGAFAGQVGEQPETDLAYDGYLIQLHAGEQSAKLAADVGLATCYAPQDLYVAQYPEEVLTLIDSGVVQTVEPNYQVSLLGTVDDPYFPKQWNIPSVGMEEVWALGLEGEGVRVALIDSGLNITHEDLEGVNIVTHGGLNLLTGSDDLSDSTGHGSFVAGVLAAARNNGIGITGLTDKITLVPIKCFGATIDTNIAYVVSAIYKAVDVYDCDVINLSLGLEKDMQSLRAAVDYAAGKGALLISAVGNGGGKTPLYPAAYENVIGVGSIGSDGLVSEFSQENSSVFIAAPGEDLFSIGGERKNAYKTGSGTSFSSPHVTALAAIARGYDPEITASQFCTLLAASADDRGELGPDEAYGYGALNAARFVEYLTSEKPSVEDFSDLQDHWATVPIERCLKEGIFCGVSADRFAPQGSMSRAMVVQVLYNMEGRPETTYVPYADVASDAWYSAAVSWATKNGLTIGAGNDLFLPDVMVTREQLVTILHRYASWKGADCSQTTNLRKFLDAEDVSDYAVPAMRWACATGLISGVTETELVPHGRTTRAQAATILVRLETLLSTVQQESDTSSPA